MVLASVRERLPGAVLRGADLFVVDLREANLYGAVLAEAKATRKTRWPKGFDPEAAGVIFE